jgi:hypothetical protein
MDTNSQSENRVVTRVPRWTLVVIGVLCITLIAAGALLLAKDQRSESNTASEISSSEPTMPTTTTSVVEAGSPSSNDSISEAPAQSPAPTQGSNRNSSSDNWTESAPPQTSPPQTSPPQTSPPQTSPPQTSPPTTICAPDTYELQRLKREYDRAQLNYQKSRGLAQYEGRYNDVRTLDLQYQANSEQYGRASEELNNCRYAYWQFTILDS